MTELILANIISFKSQILLSQLTNKITGPFKYETKATSISNFRAYDNAEIRYACVICYNNANICSTNIDMI